MKLKRMAALVLLFVLMAAMPAVAAPSKMDRVLEVATRQVGTPYALYSDAPDSFNCASFVAYCFNQVQPGTVSLDGVNSSYQKIRSTRGLQPGDIVCFKTSTTQKGLLRYHFGIYMGKGCFVHASNSIGEVAVSRLKDYKKRYIGAIRLF